MDIITAIKKILGRLAWQSARMPKYSSSSSLQITKFSGQVELDDEDQLPVSIAQSVQRN